MIRKEDLLDEFGMHEPTYEDELEAMLDFRDGVSDLYERHGSNDYDGYDREYSEWN